MNNGLRDNEGGDKGNGVGGKKCVFLKSLDRQRQGVGKQKTIGSSLKQDCFFYSIEEAEYQ